MKKVLIILCLMCLSITPCYASEDLMIESEAVILIDGKTGMVLYEKNSHEKKYPASITKIMTVYLALSNLSPDKVLVASPSAIDSIDRKSSHIWLDYKEEATVIDLAYAALLSSANDASNVLAEGVSGSLDGFVSLMNDTCVQWGCVDTTFKNAHGLPDEGHVTSAYDMALITKNAMKNEVFRTVFSTVTYKMNSTNKQKNVREFAQGNEILKNSPYFYEYANGGKIGWTQDAGYTIVTSASYNNMDLIAVVLGASSKEARYRDSKKLLDYGFSNFKTMMIKKEDIGVKEVDIINSKTVVGKAKFSISNNLNVLLPMSTDEGTISTEITVRNGDDPQFIKGFLTILISGKAVGEVAMEQVVETYDLSFGARVVPMISLAFNWFSVVILVLIYLFRIMMFLRKNTKLPD